MKSVTIFCVVLSLSFAAASIWFLTGNPRGTQLQRPPTESQDFELNDEFAKALEGKINETIDSARDAPINIELSRLLDRYDTTKGNSSAVARITAYLEDDSNQLSLAVNIRSHPKILRRLFSIYKTTPGHLTSKSSGLMRIASKCLFVEAKEFLNAIRQHGDPGLRPKAELALAACQLQRSDFAWKLQKKAMPMDSSIIEEFAWCYSEAVADDLRRLNVAETRRTALEMARQLVRNSGEDEYSKLETIAEYGEKLIAFHSHVGADTEISELAGLSRELQEALNAIPTRAVTLVVLQSDYFEREPQEQTFFTELSKLGQMPDINVFCVSTRTQQQLEDGLDFNSPGVLRCIHDEDGELCSEIGSDNVCMTCIYDRSGALRFRGDAYSSVNEIRDWCHGLVQRDHANF